MKRKTKPRSLFIMAVLAYGLITLLAAWTLADILDEALVSLLLFGFVPIVLMAWCGDALRHGEIWRQGPRSVSASSNVNVHKVTRAEHPVSFWLAISLTLGLALTIAVFVAIGTYLHVSLMYVK